MIQVSIVCITYNHGPFIRDALNGFIMQKTSFDYEVIIHDDASSDETPDIIREYQKKYPDIIKPIIQTENQFSKGVSITSNYVFPCIKGKYIAVCEGDDYWSDPLKLQKQYEIMEKHPDIDMCAHAAYMVDAKTNKHIGILGAGDIEKVFSTNEVIKGGGGFVATNSLMYRRELINHIPSFRKYWNFDYSIQIHGSLRGGIYYLPEKMSYCRRNVPGSWTQRSLNNEDRKISHYKRINYLLDLVDLETNRAFNEAIEWTKKKNELTVLELKHDYKGMKSEEYKKIYHAFPLKKKIKIFIKSLLNL